MEIKFGDGDRYGDVNITISFENGDLFEIVDNVPVPKIPSSIQKKCVEMINFVKEHQLGENDAKKVAEKLMLDFPHLT